MKRIAALILSLCLLLTVTSAFAEVAAVETATFDAFSFTPWTGSYLEKGDPSTGILFQCYPYYADGDTGSSIMAMILGGLPMDLVDMSEQDKTEFVEGMTSGVTSTFTAQGMTVTDTQVTWHDPVEADGKTGIYFDFRIDVRYFGIDISVFESAVGFYLNGDGYMFVSGGTAQEDAARIMEEFLATLTWNK